MAGRWASTASAGAAATRCATPLSVARTRGADDRVRVFSWRRRRSRRSPRPPRRRSPSSPPPPSPCHPWSATPRAPHALGTRFVCYMTACCNPCGCRRGRRIRGARATSARRRPRSAWPASRPTCASRPGPSSRWPLRRGAGQEKWAAALVFLPPPVANTCVPTYGLPQELLLRRPPPSILLPCN